MATPQLKSSAPLKTSTPLAAAGRVAPIADRILYIEDGALTHEERPEANVYRHA
jgi:hypothetical protein